jgi:hypothetical protein
MIDEAIRSGVYHDPGAALEQAFEIIREQLHREDWQVEQRQAVAAGSPMGLRRARRTDGR